MEGQEEVEVVHRAMEMEVVVEDHQEDHQEDRPDLPNSDHREHRHLNTPRLLHLTKLDALRQVIPQMRPHPSTRISTRLRNTSLDLSSHHNIQ